MKYIIKNSDIMLNGKIIPEGSEVELSEEHTKGIESFLQPCHSEPTEGSPELTGGHPELVSGSVSVSGSVEESQKKTKIKSSVALAKEGKGSKK